MRPTHLVAAAGLLTLALAAAGTAPVTLAAQNRKGFSIVNVDAGHVALGLALRRLGVTATFMQAPAHPDDETNALLALHALGLGLRTIDLQNNRGEGGQNEIGPELFRDIDVLRTSELLAAHRLDGAEQYFTRAIDYGYSFDPNEVIDKWGREAIVGDYVRLIRTLRPDVIVTMNIQGSGGDRAHEATTVLVREAYRAAGDPNRYPELEREGLRPWQASKLYFSGGPGGGRGGGGGGRGGPGGGRGGPGGGRGGPAPGAAQAHVARIDTAVYDPLLGRTYAEIGADARSAHKSQGFGGLPPVPGVGRGRGGFGGFGGTYTLVDTTLPGAADRDETSLFDGIDVTIGSLAHFAGSTPPADLIARLQAIADAANAARTAFDAGNDAGTVAPIEAGLAAVRALRSHLDALGLDADARYEIDFRLRQEERDFEDAFVAAHGLTFGAYADDGLVIAGQPLEVSLAVVNHGPVPVAVTSVSVTGLTGASACPSGTAAPDALYSCRVTGQVPADAAPTEPSFTDAYWSTPDNPAISDFRPGVPFGVPFAPTPFRVAVELGSGDTATRVDLPIRFRYVKDLYFDDKQMEVNVVPAFSVRMTPSLAVFPTAAASGAERDVYVSVTNGTKGAASADVALDLPAGWRATPAHVAVSFDGEDESRSARFVVTAPSGVPPGRYSARAVVTSPQAVGVPFTTGYQEIEYPHVERRQVIDPAEIRLEAMDVAMASNLRAGYIVGVGDAVPAAIEQLGASLTTIDSDELAWGDLSRYDVIVTGVRAYERREDLRAYNRRLIDYVEAGGTVIVQYNKFEFNQAQYGPYPAQVGRGRVADEHVPVEVLVPDHPVFNFPNRIGDAAWRDWVQERGLYFLAQKDPRYTDLVSMTDSFPDNPGEQLGSLVEARAGRGRWLYVGLALWRQLPAGTPGAYQLLANLISLPKVPASQ